MLRHRVPAAAVLLAATAGGCGGSSGGDATATPAPVRTVDDSTVESGTKQDLSSSGAEVTGVKCPSA